MILRCLEKRMDVRSCQDTDKIHHYIFPELREKQDGKQWDVVNSFPRKILTGIGANRKSASIWELIEYNSSQNHSELSIFELLLYTS